MSSNSGTKLGDAYVQVHASMVGVKQELTDGMNSAGKTAGNAFGSNFSGMIKKIAGLAIVAESGRKLGESFLTAFNESANYEQLKGGVEKIFDKMDQSKIFEDASMAYKNLNMSANEYLEIINDVGASFSATMGDKKGYEAAKTGLQAIADYSSGTGKNLDVLKEKFGMITRSTSSYQSIADQFSGILPATSKDFLKQAQAAGILDKSYTELTKVPIDEYQQAVSKMLQKGVKDLGLTNNTVNETEKTVSGSLAGLSAAWENMLAGLGDKNANIGELVGRLGQSLEAAANNVIPAVQTILGNAIKAVPEMMDSLGPMVAEGMKNAFANLSSAGDSLGKAGSEMMAALGASIKANLPSLMENALKIASGLSEKLREKAGMLVDSGLELIKNIAQGIADSMPTLIENVPTIVENIANIINDNAPKLLSTAFDIIKTLALGLIKAIPTLVANIPKITKAAFAAFMAFGWASIGKSAVTKIGDGLKSMASTIKTKATEIANRIKEPFTSLGSKLREIGGNIISGLWGGVSSAFNGFISKFKGLINLLPGAAKKLLGIASPSKVFKQIGGYVSEGLAIGIDGKSKLAVRAALGMSNDIIGAMSGRSGLITTAPYSALAYAAPASGGVNVTMNLAYDASADAVQMANDLAREVRRAIRRG